MDESEVADDVRKVSPLGELWLAIQDPIAWMVRHFWLRTPINPFTGEVLPPGPIVFTPFQQAVLRAALAREENGKFRWQTIVWSAPKKTGKTATAAAVTLWAACTFPDSEIILLANDGRQASDRVFAFLVNSLRLHPVPGATITKTEILLPNGTKVYPLPVDAEGASGANPLLTVFTELWAYTTPRKKALWDELTPPPTVPIALTWVESYAGYLGAGSVLEELYTSCMKAGTILDVPGVPKGTILVDVPGGIFYFYDHGLPATRRYAWQTASYYEQQRHRLRPHTFQRLHLNEWVGVDQRSLQPEWFQRCIAPDDSILAELDRRRAPVIIGVDVGLTHASYAIIGVSFFQNRLVVRFLEVYEPSPGTTVNLVAAEQRIIELCQQYPVIELAYDPYQFATTAQRLRQGYIVFARPFTQQQRGVADAALLSAFMTQSIVIPPTYAVALRTHYLATTWDPTRRRFSTIGTPGARNDLMVALSMAANRAMHYSSSL